MIPLIVIILILEIIVTVETQDPREVSEPLAATKAPNEVLVTVEPQGFQEVLEPLAATKA
jgi:hypothetical protein